MTKALATRSNCSTRSSLKKSASVERVSDTDLEKELEAPADQPVRVNRQRSESYAQSKIMEGFVLGAALTSYEGKVEVGTLSATSDSDSQTFGIKTGYYSVADQGLGVIVRASLGTKIAGKDWDSYTYFRPEANAAFGFANAAYVFGGINFTKLFGDGFEDFDIGLGGQFGIGYAVSPNLAFEFGHDIMQNSYNSVDLILRGFSLGAAFRF